MKMHLNYLDKCSKGGNRKDDVFSVSFSYFSIMLMSLLAD